MRSRINISRAFDSLWITRTHTTAYLIALLKFYGAVDSSASFSVPLSSFCRRVKSHTHKNIFMPFCVWFVKAVIIRCTVIFTLRLSSYCRPCADTMELEGLYRRYCDRLKHSLFLNSLLIAAVGCVVSILALCAFSSTVSRFLLQQCFTNWVQCRKLLRFKYRYAPHNDVSVHDGPHIRRWSHKIII